MVKKIETTAKNIGLELGSAPTKECADKKCPFHGNLKIRGRTFEGQVISDKMQKTVIVMWERRRMIKKYERYEKRRTKIKAHNPECINARKGDIVKISECRPLSKLKSFVVIEKIKSVA
ncbi:MAG: 30S ribosomal protein S17 [Nanoarchaeota archaeon]|nr:30S ribosomal protein S17 [Nanoarchaeota archaeon]